MICYRNKVYLRLGRHGELQFGRLSHSLVLWWHGRCYRLYRGRL